MISIVEAKNTLSISSLLIQGTALFFYTFYFLLFNPQFQKYFCLFFILTLLVLANPFQVSCLFLIYITSFAFPFCSWWMPPVYLSSYSYRTLNPTPFRPAFHRKVSFVHPREQKVIKSLPSGFHSKRLLRSNVFFLSPFGIYLSEISLM